MLCFTLESNSDDQLPNNNQIKGIFKIKFLELILSFTVNNSLGFRVLSLKIIIFFD